MLSGKTSGKLKQVATLEAALSMELGGFWHFWMRNPFG